eukprot:scaffold281870_cov21-Tisochrysis_lutea.AAC.1
MEDGLECGASSWELAALVNFFHPTSSSAPALPLLTCGGPTAERGKRRAAAALSSRFSRGDVSVDFLSKKPNVRRTDAGVLFFPLGADSSYPLPLPETLPHGNSVPGRPRCVCVGGGPLIFDLLKGETGIRFCRVGALRVA